MHISKRHLGGGYLVATGVVLATLLVAHVGRPSTIRPLWAVVLCIPAIALVGALYWLQRLVLTSEQVWTTAKWTALGLGAGMVVVGTSVTISANSVTGVNSVLLGTTLATTAVAGAAVGVVVAIRAKVRLSSDRTRSSPGYCGTTCATT